MDKVIEKAKKPVDYSRYRITDNPEGRGLYFAYGSNLDLRQMLNHRCPRAKPLMKAVLTDWRLCFRGCADVERAAGHKVVGGVFEITPACEDALDRYEGYPRMYTKRTCRITMEDGTTRRMMFYVMTNQDYESAPNESYFDTILRGYRDFQMTDLEIDTLIATAEESDHQEQRFRRANPGYFRDSRGRYRQRLLVTQESRDRYALTCQPHTQLSFADFLNEHGIDVVDLDPFEEFDVNTLGDLIGLKNL